jgi:hypothetical protein
MKEVLLTLLFFIPEAVVPLTCDRQGGRKNAPQNPVQELIP